MSSEDTKILEFNQYEKSDKVLFFIQTDLEDIIEKIAGCKKNPENSPTEKVSEHIHQVKISKMYKKNKQDVYRAKYYMKKFCESLREYEMKLLTKELQGLYENVKMLYL